MGRILYIPKPIVTGLGYGALYDIKAAHHYLIGASIAPEGWNIPTIYQATVMRTSLGGTFVAGGKAKEAGYTHWFEPNASATNESGLSLVGSGWYRSAGEFVEIKQLCELWTRGSTDGVSAYLIDAYYGHGYMSLQGEGGTTAGHPIRLIKNDPTGWVPGDTVTDYDGNVYHTTMIGTQVWTTSNLKVGHYNDGSEIVFATNTEEWTAAILAATGVTCFYNYDINNA